MTVTVLDTDVWTHECALRIPFGFGVTTLRELPQAFVTVTVSVDGTTYQGVAAEQLVPRWFSKDPDKTPAEDITDLENSIRRACEGAREMEPATTPFALWRTLYDRQRAWGETTDHPALVRGLGVSLVERGVIDAFCRATDTTFANAVRENTLGVRPGAIYDELSGVDPGECLPVEPHSSVQVRHTIGFDDPLTADDINQDAPPGQGGPVEDGLPHTLEEVIDAYGVSHFKIKIEGDPASDYDRVRRVADVVERAVPDPVYTLDANEQYARLADLRTFWDRVSGDGGLAGFRTGLAFIEQPFPRETALDDAVGDTLPTWDGPPVIIDESDARPDALGRALDRGYAGTSHKNCKGVFKSLVNACLLDRRRETGGEYVFSAEDLTTTGPVALPQDLAVVATLGIDHVERNGHHYLRGLDDFPQAVQDAVLDRYPSLYRRHEGGFPVLAIDDGSVDLTGVTEASFGVRARFDRSDFD